MVVGVLAIALGVMVLAWSSDQFVIGAARVALLRNVPSLVVGVVIVGFGTSAPEMLVSALAVIDDEVDVAIGNVVGSNLANLSVLLGVGAVIVPLAVSSSTVRREAPLVVAAMVAFAVTVSDGSVSRVEGLVLLVAMAGALIVVTIGSTSSSRLGGADVPSGGVAGEGSNVDDVESAGSVDVLAVEVEEFVDAPDHRFGVEAGRTIIGLLGTVVSAQVLLWGVLRVADEAGLSAGFVGVTLVAVGTSLPELVTVVQSARRRETDLIVGNLLGSNLFNALAVGGLIGLIGGPEVDDRALTLIAPIGAIVVAVVAALAMWTRRTVTRWEGVVLIVGYGVTVPFLS